MLFDMLRREKLQQCTKEEWKAQWKSLFPPGNRDVPITYEGETRVAFVQINHYVMMLQRVIWSESDTPELPVPGRTRFTTVGAPATPAQLVRWLNGTALSEL